jgi:hypothetical protein
VASVIASGHDGNVPQHTLDHDLATRWSASGDGQWIRYDLGAHVAINRVSVAWYAGDTRKAYFDIDVSADSGTWTRVFSGQSSGQTLQLERYDFATVSGRYVRIVGHGNSTGAWNSVTEVEIHGPTPYITGVAVASVSASGDDGNLPQNTLDHNLATRWSASGDGQWIRYDLGAPTAVEGTSIAWYLGDTRTSSFDIDVSLDAVTWTRVFSGRGSGTTLQLERYTFPTAVGRYVRLVGHGNSTGPWNSITEVEIFGTVLPVLSVVSVSASAHDGNVPRNTLDHNLGTRWSASGDGQWIRYDLGAAAVVDHAGIAWFLGDTRTASFDIEVSRDAVTWTRVFSGQSSGRTLQPEVYSFPTATGRYLRVVGYGNSTGAWNSITEVVIMGSASTVTEAPVATVTVTPTSASLLVGSAQQLGAVLKDANGSVLVGRAVTWASSALGVATVSAGGLVTGLTLGAATISATSEGQTGSALVSVELLPLPPDTLRPYVLGTGTDYYVAPTGADANPCTAAAPCYTMQRVSQLMQPGDNAHFASGTYAWTYSGNKVTKSGTASAPITYISDTKWGAKVVGGCSPISNDGDYVQIINFDVTGDCPQGITTNGHYSKVIGNRVHDLPGSSGGYAGILGDCCAYNRTGIEILGNVVDNIGPLGQTNLIHGIYLGGPNGVIMNNIVTRASAACIDAWHGATNMIIAHNTVANCGRYGIEIGADAGLTVNRNSTVINNIVVNVAGRGFHETNSLGGVFLNNLVYNNAPNFDLVTGLQAGTITLTSAQFSALFVHYTGDLTGDYRLRSGALAINAATLTCVAGVSRCVPALDVAGVPRPQGPGHDIGAYEWR